MRRESIHLSVVVIVISTIITAMSTSPVAADTMSKEGYYTWGIDSADLDISDGSIITEAVLKIEDITDWDNNLYIHIVDNPPLDFISNVDTGVGDFFSSFSGLLSGYSYELVNGDLVITFSQINDENSWTWDIFDSPFDFQLADSSTVSYSSSLLELIDYAGNGTPFGIGFDPAGNTYHYDQMKLELTVKSYEGAITEHTYVLEPSWSSLNAPYVGMSKNSYSTGEDVVVNYLNAEENSAVWIGLYNKGADSSDYLKWLRTNGASAGDITFSGLSVAGDYEARLFFNNNYIKQAEVDFRVEARLPGLNSSKSTYGLRETVTISFENASGNAMDWIGIYETGAANSNFLYWLRSDGTRMGADGILNGSVAFTNGLSAAGDYEARLFFDNSLKMESSVQFSVEGDSPSMSTAKAAFDIDEAVAIDFQNAFGDAKDWIGIYKAGSANNEFLFWIRTNGTKTGTDGFVNGSVTFADGLAEAGDYEARLFFNNSYNVEASVGFSVAEATTVSTSKSVYASGEAIVVNFENADGDAKDWIGIFATGADNSNFLYWLRSDGTKTGTPDIINGSVTFAGGLIEAGNYEARLFFKNSFNASSTTAFTIE